MSGRAQGGGCVTALSAENIAAALVISAKVYGDATLKAVAAKSGILRRSLPPACVGLHLATGAPIARVAALIGLSHRNVITARTNADGRFTTAVEQVMAALGATETEKPSRPRPCPPVETVAPVTAPSPKPVTPKDRPQIAAQFADLRRVQDDLVIKAISVASTASADGYAYLTLGALAVATDVPKGSILFVVRRLVEAGRLEVRKVDTAKGEVRQPNGYRVADMGRADPIQQPSSQVAACAPPSSPRAAPEERAPAILDGKVSSVDRLLAAMRAVATPDGRAFVVPLEICAVAQVLWTSWDTLKGKLIARGDLKLILAGKVDQPWTFWVSTGERGRALAAAEPAAAPKAAPPPPAPAAPAPARTVATRPVPAVRPPGPKAEPWLEQRSVVPARARQHEPETPTLPVPPRADAALGLDEWDDGKPGPKALRHLKAHACRWPIGTPKPGYADEQLFCAARAPLDEPYCAQHQPMSRQRGTSLTKPKAAPTRTMQ
jgi:hypothetical protein